ncbi:anthranilate synthase component I [Woodsholea maritima]|uniref:anthranilate synthase component I n=1 Tax=Woodsholea maritima TaxID=240237 RepID=UPI000367B524|nr:anthranilate synthase component I [Woodsholea maritima]
MAEISPRLEAASLLYERGQSVLLIARRVDDLETPVSAYLKLSAAFEGPSFLLESVEGGAYRGRYSAIGLNPDVIWRCIDGKADIAEAEGLETPSDFKPAHEAPLVSLQALLDRSAMDMPRDLAPMAAGLFGYLGYDMIRQVERLPVIAAPDPLGVPEAIQVRPRAMVIFDALTQEILITAPMHPKAGVDAETAYRDASAQIEAVLAALDEPGPRRTKPSAAPEIHQAPHSNTTVMDYHAHVETARTYIRAGDIFQVVPSQRFRAPLEASPFAFYRSLRRTNPSPFLYFFDFGDFHIAGSSPEILVRVRDRRMTVRPIAGTRKRGGTLEEDLALEADLLADPKERSEHLMLLDLGRNDVGRVAKAGTVKVTEREIIERYSQVMHLVSSVEGDLLDGETALTALFAGFPAGTVSGAPKVRAMEIIEELEPHRRGIYAGAIGYFSAGGGLDTCIALRTAVIKDGYMHVQAGGGVVLDSDPEFERQETINKASALFRAAEDTWRFT